MRETLKCDVTVEIVANQFVDNQNCVDFFDEKFHEIKSVMHATVADKAIASIFRVLTTLFELS